MGCELSVFALQFTMLADDLCRVVLLNYREDGVTPFLTIWKHGLKEEKV